MHKTINGSIGNEPNNIGEHTIEIDEILSRDNSFTDEHNCLKEVKRKKREEKRIKRGVEYASKHFRGDPKEELLKKEIYKILEFIFENIKEEKYQMFDSSFMEKSREKLFGSLQDTNENAELAIRNLCSKMGEFILLQSYKIMLQYRHVREKFAKIYRGGKNDPVNGQASVQHVVRMYTKYQNPNSLVPIFTFWNYYRIEQYNIISEFDKLIRLFRQVSVIVEELFKYKIQNFFENPSYNVIRIDTTVDGMIKEEFWQIICSDDVLYSCFAAAKDIYFDTPDASTHIECEHSLYKRIVESFEQSLKLVPKNLIKIKRMFELTLDTLDTAALSIKKNFEYQFSIELFEIGLYKFDIKEFKNNKIIEVDEVKLWEKKTTEISGNIDELYNYIINETCEDKKTSENHKTKKKKKKKNTTLKAKGNHGTNTHNNEIVMENESDPGVDLDVESFKNILKDTIPANKVTKIKPIFSQEWMNNIK